MDSGFLRSDRYCKKSSAHYGATIPYGGNTVKVPPNGEVMRNLYLCDSACFPDLPAVSPTFTIMANAHRTAVEAIRWTGRIIAVTGANSYLGRSAVEHLIASTDHQDLRIFFRRAAISRRWPINPGRSVYMRADLTRPFTPELKSALGSAGSCVPFCLGQGAQILLRCEQQTRQSSTD